MNSATRGALTLGVAASAIAACEKGTVQPAHPTIDARQEHAMQSWANERAEQQGPTAKQRAIGGGPSDRTPRTTSATQASTWIAVAQCDREARCNNIGRLSAKYASREQCLAAVLSDKTHRTVQQVCPGGVSDVVVSTCLQAIQDEACANRLDSVTRMNACRPEGFCTQQVPGTGTSVGR